MDRALEYCDRKGEKVIEGSTDVVIMSSDRGLVTALSPPTFGQVIAIPNYRRQLEENVLFTSDPSHPSTACFPPFLIYKSP